MYLGDGKLGLRRGLRPVVTFGGGRVRLDCLIGIPARLIEFGNR